MYDQQSAWKQFFMVLVGIPTLFVSGLIIMVAIFAVFVVLSFLMSLVS